MTNTAYGSGALAAVTTGTYDSAFGDQAMANLTTGAQNTGVGSFALRLLVTGSFNSAMGQSALPNATGSGNSALGQSAGASLTTGSYCTFVGKDAGYHPSQKADASNSIALGFKAYATKDNQAVLGNLSTTETMVWGELRGGFAGDVRIFNDYGTNNFYIASAGPANPTGSVTGNGCVAIGYNAMLLHTAASNCVALGTSALEKSGGEQHTAVGAGALQNCNGSTSAGHTAFGKAAAASLTAGTRSTFIGCEAGSNASQKVDPVESIAIGAGAYTTKDNQAVIGGSSITETVLQGEVLVSAQRALLHQGSSNNFFYAAAGPVIPSSGTGNVAMGIHALGAITSGSGCAAVGVSALAALTTGNDHTAIGNGALSSLAGGVGCTAVGRWAARDDTAGGNITAIGDTALQRNTTGISNSALGYAAAWRNTTGQDNVAIGVYAAAYRQSSSRWVVIGSEALANELTDDISDTVAVGYRALYATTGKEQVALGSEALRNHVAGSRNTGVGFRAGQRLTDGSDCVFIGHQAGENTNQKTDALNAVAIGANSYTTKDDQVSIGSDSVTETVLHGVQKWTPYLVANLPAASDAGLGARSFVSDADGPVFGNAVIGGSSTPVPVYSDGSVWLVG